jgi:GGDEF domain-containing protein
MACWTFGEIWYAVFQPETYPSVADLGFIAFYPLLYVGIVLLLRSRARTIGRALWLDGATAALAAGAFGAALVFEQVADVTAGSTSVVVTNLAYPLGDVLLLSAVFGVFALTGWRPGMRWALLGLGVLSTALADSIYLFQSAEGTYVEGTWIDVLWPTALLLIAASAWVNDRTRAGLTVEGRPLLAVPAICAVIATGILVYDHFTRLNILAIALATGTLALVVVRLAMTFRENSRLFELTRQEAITDVLTGLGNRRQLVSDLERRLVSEPVAPTLLMLFDLDGFKGYNDTFGHPAGDALLARLGTKLAGVPGDGGTAYRLGGDEFCLLATVGEGEAEPLIDRACDALTERGEGFEIGSSFGAVMLPDEPRMRATPCRSPTSGCTRRSTRGEAKASGTMAALLRPCRSGSQSSSRSAPTSALWRSTWARPSACGGTSSTSSSARLSSTTSASSPSPTRFSTSPSRSTSGNGVSCVSTRSSANASCALRRRSAASRASSARATRTGTAADTRTDSPPTRSPSPRASSGSAARTWR